MQARRQPHVFIVVGAGSAGYAAARTARDVGCDVALVDTGPLGGLCILRGCMPSKALLASSDALQDARDARGLGIHASEITVDMPFIAARKRELVEGFAEYRIEGINEFPLYKGPARFLSPTQLLVGENTILEAPKFVVATGSVVTPNVLPGLSETGYLDSDSVLELEHIPKSVVVLGGGYTACELGQFLARMGARTTILIRSGHLLTDADDDVGDALTGYFLDEAIEVITRASLLDASRRGGKKVVRYLKDGTEREVVADEIFYALGRLPNVAGLDLEKAGIAYGPRDGIAVDRFMRTSNPNIYAVGDVTGEYMLVHVAIYQGEVASRNACLDLDEAADYNLVGAHTVFTDPQFAAVGMSEKELKASGVPYVSGRYEFAEHGKAQCLGKTKGFVKMMADPSSGRILGAQVLGPEGSELIHELIVAMRFEATVDQFMRIPHLHPTLAEIWTYPAEFCAAQLGRKIPGDEQIELATSAAGE
ncbi:MAG TPA: dihydrolipoyl dehydrogenase [Candidatus Acidoferrales bacterium]|jgi:pyruvate/2-oxoglutarate dehydrogenase complex dihydrolipoamide dehydrogenase (E3) component|nr:dihydrolipoyl dehydrogenase [Candidatus Acidoferrales bacterium]